MLSRILTLLIIVFFSFAAFAQKEITLAHNTNDPNDPLFSSSWNLVELYGSSTLQPGLKQAYLIFQRGALGFYRMSGYTGCNYFGGRINLVGDHSIVFHPDLITNDNCAGSTVETPLMDALINADKWSEKNGQLLLHRKGKVIARWNPSSTYNANLDGTWHLMYLGGLSAPFAEIFPDSICPRVVFSGKATVANGFSGCHAYAAPFLINQHSIVFMESTPCDTNCAVKEENVFLQILSSINGYYFKDAQTLVFVNNGQPVMAFNRRKLPVDSVSAGR